MSFFQSDFFFVAHQPLEKVSGVGASGEKLGVSATIGYTGYGVAIVIDDLGHKIGIKATVWAEEMNIELAF